MKGEFEEWIEKRDKHARNYPKLTGEQTTEQHKVGFWDGTILTLLKVRELIDEARKELPQFGDFTHAQPDNLTAEDFLQPSMLEFADFYGYVTAMNEFKKKWFGGSAKQIKNEDSEP